MRDSYKSSAGDKSSSSGGSSSRGSTGY
jgi:hypothetical protein